MKLHRCLFIILILLLSLAVGDLLCADRYDVLRSDYHQLSRSPQLQRQRVTWERLLKRFDNFISQNPLSKKLDKAMFLQARTWDGLSRASGRKDDAEEALTRYVALSQRFPDSNLSDDALFYAGQAAEFRLKDKTRAAQLYQQIISRFPLGDKKGEALKQLEGLPAPPPSEPAVQVPVQKPIVSSEGSYHQKGDAPRLQTIRFWSGPEYTRIVLDLSAPVVAKPHVLKGDNPRIYFDLLYTQPSDSLIDNISIQNGLVRKVRSSLFDEQRMRVVIDLNRAVDYRLITLENPHRLVVDVLGTPETTVTAPQRGGASRAAADDSIANLLDRADRLPSLHVPQTRDDDGIRLVVVDAGHGGRDPGAVGPSGVLEKDVTLRLAKVLAEALRRDMGVKVLMTRTDDRYLKLRERTEYANRVGADLFISLHANASPRGKAYGIETYFLNLSKNNQAAEVAARENGTSLQEVGNLEAILFDLMANAKINESSRLAAEVQQSMVAGLRPHFNDIKDLGVKQGPFHVLLGATMPSVLIEAAFISHPREEKRLTSRSYQQRVANSIVRGVKHYATSVDQVAKR